MRTRFGCTVIAIAGLLFVGAVGRANTQAKAEEPVQIVEMTAKKYKYAPEEIRVKQGTRVQLKIRATDRTHGFKIRLYPEGTPEKGEPGLRMTDNQNNFKLGKNQERIIEFVAERPGTYVFRCSVFCGMGHRGMSGKVIVE
ncbi:MAG: cupredoxin domain-containing protein [Acidobacteria bacterium]|nr:cupredoxin domain-containing protein [Acidobacteriota bacterium]MCL5288331.1 cupredoxin domain-containing protein [Acidobacteriota bacterium]